MIGQRTLESLFNRHLNNLNLMRLIAALAVIYGHAAAVTGKGPPDVFLQFVGFKFIGGVAVDVFFVISGFLITASVLGKNGLKYYLASRVLRIYPALLVCVSFTVLVVGPILTISDNYWSDPITWHYFWRNTTAYGTEYFLPGVFNGLHEKAVNGSLWSLAVEIRLYLLLLIAQIIGVFRYDAIFNFLFFSLLIAGYFDAPFINTIFPSENHQHVALMFLLGSFAWINKGSIPITPILMAFLLFFTATLHGSEKFLFFYPIFLTYFVLYVAVVPWAAWFNRYADYSYGVYLYGWLSQQLVLVAVPKASNGLNTLLGCTLALFIAFFSWHFIEKPFLNFKKHFITQRVKDHV